jgi:hypothetical protein
MSPAKERGAGSLQNSWLMEVLVFNNNRFMDNSVRSHKLDSLQCRSLVANR